MEIVVILLYRISLKISLRVLLIIKYYLYFYNGYLKINLIFRIIYFKKTLFIHLLGLKIFGKYFIFCADIAKLLQYLLYLFFFRNIFVILQYLHGIFLQYFLMDILRINSNKNYRASPVLL